MFSQLLCKNLLPFLSCRNHKWTHIYFCNFSIIPFAHGIWFVLWLQGFESGHILTEMYTHSSTHSLKCCERYTNCTLDSSHPDESLCPRTDRNQACSFARGFRGRGWEMSTCEGNGKLCSESFMGDKNLSREGCHSHAACPPLAWTTGPMKIHSGCS